MLAQQKIELRYATETSLKQRPLWTLSLLVLTLLILFASTLRTFLGVGGRKSCNVRRTWQSTWFCTMARACARIPSQNIRLSVWRKLRSFSRCRPPAGGARTGNMRKARAGDWGRARRNRSICLGRRVSYLVGPIDPWCMTSHTFIFPDKLPWGPPSADAEREQSYVKKWKIHCGSNVVSGLV